MDQGEGVEGADRKRDPADFALWKAAKPSEDTSWPSPWGPGRPGWHIECSAMAEGLLGPELDVHGGGTDLVFPHHEMSASEAQAAFDGLTFARSYVHAGMVGYEGEKMSKSKGNLVLVSRLREAGVDPMAIRLALLAHHYRTDWEWTDADLAAGEGRLAAWRTAVTSASREQAEDLVRGVRAALADDLDAPRALAVVDDWAAAERGDGSGADLVRALLDGRLGVVL
jgi:L-cysteine:1D-myo-inositol 2-amino-2-deoxy-alpha-D-glucopyranoside ligase